MSEEKRCPTCGGELDAWGCLGEWNGTHQDAVIRLLTAERDRYRKGLEDILTHMRFSAPALMEYSGVVAIARAALEGDAQ